MFMRKQIKRDAEELNNRRNTWKKIYITEQTTYEVKISVELNVSISNSINYGVIVHELDFLTSSYI